MLCRPNTRTIWDCCRETKSLHNRSVLFLCSDILSGRRTRSDAAIRKIVPTSWQSEVNPKRIRRQICHDKSTHRKYQLLRDGGLTGSQLLLTGHFTQIASGKADECNRDFATGGMRVRRTTQHENSELLYVFDFSCADSPFSWQLSGTSTTDAAQHLSRGQPS